MTMTHPIIEFENVSLNLGTQRILDNVSLVVQAGDYLSLIGPNGAGKTTILKCLVRIIEEWQGEIRLNGQPLGQYSQKELAKWVSYVPQTQPCNDIPFTVEEFVTMGRYPYMDPFTPIHREDKDAVENAMEMTGVTVFRNRCLMDLSGGEYQKVLIAAALAQEAKILVLDEPSTYLDYKHQLEIRRLLTYINGILGITVILVTHDINDAIASSSRILALKGGKTVFCGDIKTLLEENVLESLYETSFLFVPRTDSEFPIVVQDWFKQ